MISARGPKRTRIQTRTRSDAIYMTHMTKLLVHDLHD